ncbi:mediator of RNA polymerase II transcription subunit 1-like isoform X2 [Montipora capricornis]|uniref:mediator of RNA polymerase II transcription subunit 1-like isoform X2 n=1 Tax=Montipora capricornis TaxID=246305 RepID=UPI0035F0FF2A
MAATVDARTCGSCCLKLKELVSTYEQELGLKGKEFNGTKIHAFGSLNFYSEHSKFTDLLNSIRSKCQSCASWPDPAKAIRASLERQQQIDNLAPVKNYISECLGKLQSAMTEKSIKVVTQRLEAITKKVGLKFIENGRDVFINSDMFYVEVRMEANGTVSEVKVAHTGDPESCPELTRILRDGDYDEFLCHLRGLCDLYQLSRDTFQKPKFLAALKAVETDINLMANLFGTDLSSTEAIIRCPVGFLIPRQGGRRMRLVYFASPYELLDVDRPGQDRQFTREDPPLRDFGYQVAVSLEQSQKTTLPISPLMLEPVGLNMLGWDSSIKYQALNDNNSEEFNASFVLELCKPLPASVEVVQKIHEVVCKAGNFSHSSRIPIDSLIIKEHLKDKNVSLGDYENTFYASLPQHHHTYHVTENQSTPDELVQPSGMGLLLYRIAFTHPSHIRKVLELLRRQAMFNTLLSSAFRSHKPLNKKPGCEEYRFELRASDPFTLTITFEHPCTSSMASIDFFVTPDLTVKATLNTVHGKPLFCSNDYISRVTQRCLSIPAAMRCIIRKAQSVKLDELPVKTSEELPLPVGFVQPSTKLASLSLPPSAALFGAAVGTPSNPNTPVFHGTSPSFTSFTLETPSPTFSAFPFSSISPTFSFSATDVNASSGASETTMNFGRQEKKPNTPKQSNLANPLKILLKRKRADEYVIEKGPVTDELPKNEAKTPGDQQGMGSFGKGSDNSIAEAMDTENFAFDLAAVSAANFVVGTTFQDAAAGLGGSSGNGPGVAATESIAGSSGLGIVPGGIEGLPASADLFDIGAAGADGTDLEGILQNLSGASHLPPGIVPGGSALDFDTGLGPGLDVSDPGFDIDAAIDASAAVSDPSIAGAAAAFDVDSTLDFDLDHIAAVGGLPPDVTSGADLLAVSGLGTGEGSVDMDIPGTSQSKIQGLG